MTCAVSAFAIYDRWIENSKVWSRKTHSTERVLRGIIITVLCLYVQELLKIKFMYNVMMKNVNKE